MFPRCQSLHMFDAKTGCGCRSSYYQEKHTAVCKHKKNVKSNEHLGNMRYIELYIFYGCETIKVQPIISTNDINPNCFSLPSTVGIL